VVCNVANNHAGDLDSIGLKETTEYLSSAGFTIIGSAFIGNERRGILTRIHIKNTSIGIVSWTKWMNRNYKNKSLPIYREEDVINVDWKEAKEKHDIDILIGFPHWDFEQMYCPFSNTVDFAGKLLQNFDILCGTGPHVMQPIQVVNGPKICAYSIGNFCGKNGTWQTKVGGIFEVNIGEKKIQSYEMYPFIDQIEEADDSQMILPLEFAQKNSNFQKQEERLKQNSSSAP